MGKVAIISSLPRHVGDTLRKQLYYLTANRGKAKKIQESVDISITVI